MTNGSLRVLLTVDAVGGIWQYGLDLARGLTARGVEPVLALLGPAPDAAQLAEAEAIAGATLIRTSLPLDWLCDEPGAVLQAGRAIDTLARDVGADLVHLNSPALRAGMSPVSPVVAVTHGCIASWWEAAEVNHPIDESLSWHAELMSQGLHAADRVIAPSFSFARRIARHYALPAMPQIVHNGRTALPTATSAQVDRALTVGRLWDRVKRADLLDRVAARLKVPFDAAGQPIGPQGEHGALVHLNLLGQLDARALGRRLAQRPVFVSAASFEPFGLSVLEAANAGCALVLSDIDSFRELWGDAALFVCGDDPAAYAAAIESLIANPPLRERYGKAASRRAARYTAAAMADGMFAIYADVLVPASRTPARSVAA